MASRLRLTLVLSAIVLMGCGARGDVRAKVALFQQRANASQYAEIRREYNQANLIGFDFDRDMLARARLGRMIRMWGVSKSTAARWLQVNRWMNGGQPRTTELSCRRPVKGPEPRPYPADPALTISALFACRLRYSPSFISSPA